MLIFEVRAQSPLTWCQNCSRVVLQKKQFFVQDPLTTFDIIKFSSIVSLVAMSNFNISKVV